MSNRGSNCCCTINGFDVYGLHTIGAFLYFDQDLTVTTQLNLIYDNWFVDYLTRVNVLGAGTDGAATPVAFSTTIAPPVTRPLDRPEAPDTGFNLGSFFRTSLNTKDGLVLWIGEYAEMEFDGADLVRLDSIPFTTGAHFAHVAVITSTDVGAALVGQYVAENVVGDPTQYTLPGWVSWYLAFDADRMYFNPTYWFLSGKTAFAGYFPVDRYYELTNEGTTGLGLIGGGWADNVAADPFDSLRNDVSPWHAKTVTIAIDALSIYETSHLPPWSTDEGTVVEPGNWQAYFDELGEPWATYLAKDDPTTAFGYKITVVVHEEPSTGQLATGGTFSNQNWVEEYSRSLVLGTVGADGIVVGDEVWTSGAYELVSTTFYGMTAAAVECDSWDDVQAGIYFTTAASFSGAKGSRTVSTRVANSLTDPNPPYGTWPPSDIKYWSANALPASGVPDFGVIDDMVDQLNNSSVTRDAADAKVAVVVGGDELFSVPLYHPGWLPQSVRVAHDGTGDVFIAERYRAGGISPYDVSATVGTAQHGLGINNAPANSDRTISLAATSGNRVALVAAYKGTLANVRVTSTGGVTGSHTVLQSGTIGDWSYELVECNTTSTTARQVRAQRTTAGLLALGWLFNNVSGATTYTVGTVGATPSAPPDGYAAAQLCLTASPIAASVQDSKILLSGQGRVLRNAVNSDGVYRALGMITGFTHVWSPAVDNDWTFGTAVTDTIGFTMLTPLDLDSGWNAGHANALPTQSPTLHSGHGARIRRVTQAGVTKWVTRAAFDGGEARVHFANSDEMVIAPMDLSLGINRMLVIDAVTGEARGVDYPAGSIDGGWYLAYYDALLRWSIVPVADSLSTKNLAAWIAADKLPHGVG